MHYFLKATFSNTGPEDQILRHTYFPLNSDADLNATEMF